MKNVFIDGRTPGALPDTPRPSNSLKHSGKTIRSNSGQTILGSPRTGYSIGNTAARLAAVATAAWLLDGEVINPTPNCLSESEQAAGYWLACCSYANLTNFYRGKNNDFDKMLDGVPQPRPQPVLKPPWKTSA